MVINYRIGAGFNYAFEGEEKYTMLHIPDEVSFIEAGIIELLEIDEHAKTAAKEISLHLSRTPITENTSTQQAYLEYIRDILKQIAPSIVARIISIGVHLSGSRFEGYGLLGATNTYQPTSKNKEQACNFVTSLQSAIGLPVWLENANFYSEGPKQVLQSWEHIKIICQETGCGVIVDLAHLVVEANNNGIPSEVILGSIPWNYVKEIHLSGITYGKDGSMHDGHNHPIPDSVWSVLETSLLLIPEENLAKTIFTIEHIVPAWATKPNEFKTDFQRLLSTLNCPREKINFSSMSNKYMRGYLLHMIKGQIPLLEKACEQRGLLLNGLLDCWLLSLSQQERRVIFDSREVPPTERSRCAVLTTDFLSFAKTELYKKDAAYV